MSDDPGVRLRLEEGVVHLTLDRPQTRNALSLAMVDTLLGALARAEEDEALRAVVLRGAGGHFCSGGDLKDMATARAAASTPAARDALHAMSERFGQLCAAFAGSRLATVAVLEGTVMGGGFGLACAVDVALAASGVNFRLPETSLGVVPAQIAPYLVERIGISQARRLAVTGGRIDGVQALALGLVHELHDPEALDAALARLLAQVLACAPGAVAATKALMAQAQHRGAAELIGPAARLFADAVLGEEGQEGTLAFIEKRPPRWVQR